jgi:hypothetical protein
MPVREAFSTSKTRTYSLSRRGCMLFDLIPNMPVQRLLPLIQKFNEVVSNAAELGAASAQS